jgi:glutathione S-transferase
MIVGKVSNDFLKQELATHFKFLESQLSSAPDSGPFLCGAQLMAADIQMSIPILAALTLSIITKEEYPRIASYAEELQSTEGYQRAARKVEELEGKPFVAIKNISVGQLDPNIVPLL